MSPRPTSRSLSSLACAAAALGLLAMATIALVPGARAGTGTVVSGALYAALIAGATVVVVGHARRTRRRRAAWRAVAAATVMASASAVAWLASSLVDGPGAHWLASDLLSLAVYPCVGVGVLLLARGTEPQGSAVGPALDGVAAAALVGAIAVAALGGAFAGLAPGTSLLDLEVVVPLAFPVGDVALLALLAGLVARLGRRTPPTALRLGAGIALTALGDVLFSLTDYHPAGLIDLLWPTGALLIAWAARTADAERSYPVERSARGAAVVPVAVGSAAIVLLAVQPAAVGPLSVVLATGALLAASARLGLLLRDAARALSLAEAEGRLDPLTGLGNRRALWRDLDAALRSGRPHVLALFDLDGFKAYNDHHGHMAGDVLLRRLGGRLARAAEGHGGAYRLGGDELCLLLELEGAPAARRIGDTAEGLREEGDTPIGASVGVAALPAEASTVDEALALADRRMYAQKHRGGLSRSPLGLAVPTG